MKDFFCPICNELLFHPLILSCGDTMCKSCLCQHFQIEALPAHASPVTTDHVYLCPVCNLQIRLPDGIDGLPKHGVFVEMIARMHAEREFPEGAMGCGFCRDTKRTGTSLHRCLECRENYCLECFASHHKDSSHSVIELSKSTKKAQADVSSERCRHHNDQRKQMFCADCQVAICFFCKEEDGNHASHTTQISSKRRTADLEELGNLSEVCTFNAEKVSDYIQRLDEFSLKIKHTGLESEAHVNREFNRLIDLIEVKRERLLTEISTEYNTLSEGTDRIAQTLLSDRETLVQIKEVFEHAISSESEVALIESMNDIKKRENRITGRVLDNLRRSKQHLKVVPFKGKIIDMKAVRSYAKKIKWVAPPQPPYFSEEACFAENNSVHLYWNDVIEYQLDHFVLEVSKDGGMSYEAEYRGKERHFFCESLEYGRCYLFRVCANNGAGNGDYSDVISITTAKGFEFQMDIDQYSIEDRSKSIVAQGMDVDIFSDVSVRTGVHYWRVKFNDVEINDATSTLIKVGVHENLSKGEALELTLYFDESLQPHVESPSFFIKDACLLLHLTVSFVLNLNDSYLDIYVNGNLKQSQGAAHTFPEIRACNYHVFARLRNVRTELFFENGLRYPTQLPEVPEFTESECFADNLDVHFHWSQACCESYILEVVQDEAKPDEQVYAGNSDQFVLKAERYAEIIFARLFAVNFLGVSEASQTIAVKTPIGFDFSFEEIESDSLKLWNNNRSLKYSDNEPVLLFADSTMRRGLHFWRFEVERFAGIGRIEFGLSKRGVSSAQEFGQRNSWVISMHSEKEESTDRKIVLKINEDFRKSDVSLIVDMTTRTLWFYLNGMLVTKENDASHTFHKLSRSLVPSVLVSGDFKLDLICPLPPPSPPAPPTFRNYICENTTCYFEWYASSSPGSYTDRFKLKVAIVDLSKAASSKDIYRTIYEGTGTCYTLKDLKYNSKILAVLLAENTCGESLESGKIEIFTPKGFRFRFNRKPGSTLKLHNDGYSVLLKNPTHSYVLGDQGFSRAITSWSIRLDEFGEKNKMSVAGIGLSRSSLNDPILGEDDFTYAVQIIEHPKVQVQHTSHRYQVQMDSEVTKGSIVFIEVDLDQGWINIHINGVLLLREPSHKTTFENVQPGNYFPAVSLYGKNLKLSVVR